MKKIALMFFAAIVSVSLFAQTPGGQLPENPEPGKCYVKCVTPDEFNTVTERVMTAPAYKKVSVVPAEYKWEEERVLVKEASKRYEFVPAEYEIVYVDYTKTAGFNEVKIIPASFGNDSKTIEVKPKVGRWEYQAYAGCESDNPADCQVLCWREYPAEFTSVTTKTLAQDAGFNATPVAAKMDRYAKQVVKKPAEVREIEVPAVYETIRKRVLVKDEGTVETTVPAQYTEVSKEVLSKKGGITSWEEVDCELLDYNVLPINYDLASARIKTESKKIIDERLLKLMREKPGIRVELNAHTDSRGSDSYNLDLSERRAQSVVNYLVSKGINRSRLVAKGYGETRLKNNCADGVECSESMHAQNRRTEFRILNN